MGNYRWVNHSFVIVIFSSSKHFIVVKIGTILRSSLLHVARFLASNIAAVDLNLFSYVTNANIYLICQFYFYDNKYI